MPLLVQKFGGTSVADAEKILAAARRAIRAQQRGQPGRRGRLSAGAHHRRADRPGQARSPSSPPAREMDMLLSTGEQVSVALMAMAIQALGEPAISFTGAQIGIVTDSSHTKARIQTISTERMQPGPRRRARSSSSPASRASTRTTTSPRSAAAAATPPPWPWPPCCGPTRARSTPTSTASTRPTRGSCPRPARSTAISYDEMLELASLGAGVMHSRSIEFAKKFDVPIHVRSSLHRRRRARWIVAEAERAGWGRRSPGRPWPRTRPGSRSWACPTGPGVVHTHLPHDRRRRTSSST